MDLAKKTLLVIAPHPDDEVIGCGGLISRVKAKGGKVYVLYLTVAATDDFVKRGKSTKNERVAEIKRVVKALHVDGWQIAFPGAHYHLRLDTAAQKDLIHAIERKGSISLESLRPDMIAFPFSNDYNQDHRAAATAALTACRPTRPADKFVPPVILSYEAPMSSWTTSTALPPVNFFIELEEKQVSAKVKAMGLYESQVREPGHTRNGETLRALAILRGSSMGTQYAEAFYAHRLAFYL